jgi:DNA-binding transcriptional regulator YdaS (Cro superfamily)
MRPDIDEGLRLAIEAAGSSNALARLLGMSAQAFSEWRRVPAGRILQVEAVTSIPREKLRPDLYRSNNNLAPSAQEDWS